MSTNKHLERTCWIVLALVLVLTVLFMNGEKLGLKAAETVPAYQTKLFDTSKVHTVNIVMDDWDSFIDSCENEEYANCTVVIDGDTRKNVAIRAKGNTSLQNVASYGNDRYSFKIEFDHNDSTQSYFGLDKLNLNNIIQDNTYMKDYLTYQMMREFGVDAPLCSYVNITVNGENKGLYLAVEAVEDAYLARTTNSTGDLYKPDSMSMGGGRGNGEDFSMTQALGSSSGTSSANTNASKPNNTNNTAADKPSASAPEKSASAAGSSASGTKQAGMAGPGMGGGDMAGSDDVSLVYSDDNAESYANIFDNAKTNVTEADQTRLIASIKQLNDQQNVEEVVDTDAVMRYFVVHNFVDNFDSYTGSLRHNYYLYEKDGVMSMIPWDYNLAFGGFQGASNASSLINYPIDTPVSGGTVDDRPMLSWILDDSTYTNTYHTLFSSFISDYFDSGKFAEEYDKTVALISPYVEADTTKFCTYDEFTTGSAALKKFCLLRAESITGQLDGSIPSTSDGQSKDSSSLVDATGLNVTAMGGMGAGQNAKTQTADKAAQSADGTSTQTADKTAQSADGTSTQTTDKTAQSADGTSTQTADKAAQSADGTSTQAAKASVQASVKQSVQAAADTQQSAPGATPPDGTGGGTPPDGMSPPDGTTQPSGTMQNPQGSASGSSSTTDNAPGGQGGPQQNGSNQSTTGTTSYDWILLGVSAAVLAGGLLFAFKFRRRR